MDCLLPSVSGLPWNTEQETYLSTALGSNFMEGDGNRADTFGRYLCMWDITEISFLLSRFCLGLVSRSMGETFSSQDFPEARKALLEASSLARRLLLGKKRQDSSVLTCTAESVFDLKWNIYSNEDN